MSAKRYTPEQIVRLLREAEVLQSQGLERENARLKQLVGEQALDIAILKEASRGN